MPRNQSDIDLLICGTAETSGVNSGLNHRPGCGMSAVFSCEAETTCACDEKLEEVKIGEIYKCIGLPHFMTIETN